MKNEPYIFILKVRRSAHVHIIAICCLYEKPLFQTIGAYLDLEFEGYIILKSNESLRIIPYTLTYRDKFI